MMFQPSRAQARAKSEFQRKTKGNAMLGPLESLPVAKLEQLSGVSCMDAWLKEEGFRAWFLNTEYNKDLLESGAELAIKAAIEIIEDTRLDDKGNPLVKPSDKLNAAKLILAYAGYAPKNKDEDLDKSKDIDNMSEEALDKIIKRGLKSSNGSISLV